MSMILDTTIAVRTVSEANMCEHWSKRYKRSKSQKKTVSMHLEGVFKSNAFTLPCKVILTRVGKRRLDSDNLASSLKYVRDAIAEWLVDSEGKLAPGQADGDERIEWIYKQEIGPQYAVRVQI